MTCCTRIQNLLIDPKVTPLALALVAAAALIVALTAQYGFGLAPCNLCVIQRWPFGFVVALGLAGFLIAPKSRKGAALTVALSALAFAANTVIAFYHSGVERHWWRSFLEGCAVPQLEGSIEEVMAMIQAAPVVRCDEIPWADPVFGLSMANYNVAFCLGLAVISAASAILIFRKT